VASVLNIPPVAPVYELETVQGDRELNRSVNKL
jgi:hypothetical protein